MLYLNVILFFVSKKSTFDSPDFQYLEIFGLIRIDFMTFTNNGFVGIYSVFHKQKFVSSLPIIYKKKLICQILLYVTER